MDYNRLVGGYRSVLVLAADAFAVHRGLWLEGACPFSNERNVAPIENPPGKHISRRV
jgi:hypothetical protein